MKLETLENYKDDVEKFEIYLLENYPKFPQSLSKVFLARFLKTCNRNFEESGKLLKKNLDLRAKNAEIFMNRNFFDEKTVSSRNTL
jgi:hypothetical protein